MAITRSLTRVTICHFIDYRERQWQSRPTKSSLMVRALAAHEAIVPGGDGIPRSEQNTSRACFRAGKPRYGSAKVRQDMKAFRLGLHKVRQNMKPYQSGEPPALSTGSVTWNKWVRKARSHPRKFSLVLVILLVVFGFPLISRVLLSSVDGSFTPNPYSSLALESTSSATKGVVAGEAVPVKLVNRTGHFKTYHWSATQSGGLLSLGEEALENGKGITILIPTRGAAKGTLRIALTGTNVFVTVPILKS
jgi:hypothetical protein